MTKSKTSPITQDLVTGSTGQILQMIKMNVACGRSLASTGQKTTISLSHLYLMITQGNQICLFKNAHEAATEGEQTNEHSSSITL